MYARLGYDNGPKLTGRVARAWLHRLAGGRPEDRFGPYATCFSAMRYARACAPGEDGARSINIRAENYP